MCRSALILSSLAAIVAASTFTACADDPPATTVPPVFDMPTTGPGGDGQGGSGGGDLGGMGGDMSGGGGTGGASTAEEDCANGIDDDLDGLVDCVDADPSCAAQCANGCASPMVLADGATYHGDTQAHAVGAPASCASPLGAGPSHVFAVTADVTGKLEASLTTDQEQDNFSLAVRTACDDMTTELACSERVVAHEAPTEERISVDAIAGETYFVVVQGYSSTEEGAYHLSVGTRVPSCPDGQLDEGEGCDDGDMIDDNGCSNTCVFQPSEVEANDLPAEANTFIAPWYAAIEPAGDADMVDLDFPEHDYGVVISVLDLGNGDCAQAALDSYVQLYDKHFNEVAFDDNSGDGLCARLSARGLAKGEYQARVRSAPLSDPDHTFQYRLVVEGDRCGNGTIGGPEQCDDGNNMPGDGCSPLCALE